MEIQHDTIELTPQIVGEQSLRFGALIKAIEDWETSKGLNNEGAKFVLASMAMIAANIPQDQQDIMENIPAILIDLYVKRKAVFPNGLKFAFPFWEADVSRFERNLADFGLFTVFVSLGFRMGFDAIAIADEIYQRRPQVQQYARLGYLQTSVESQKAYELMKSFFASNPMNLEIYQWIAKYI